MNFRIILKEKLYNFAAKNNNIIDRPQREFQAARYRKETVDEKKKETFESGAVLGSGADAFGRIQLLCKLWQRCFGDGKGHRNS